MFLAYRLEAMRKVEVPACKKDLQKFLGKINYLRRFISNLFGKIDVFTSILRLKNEAKKLPSRYTKSTLEWIHLQTIPAHPFKSKSQIGQMMI